MIASTINGTASGGLQTNQKATRSVHDLCPNSATFVTGWQPVSPWDETKDIGIRLGGQGPEGWQTKMPNRRNDRAAAPSATHRPLLVRLALFKQ